MKIKIGLLFMVRNVKTPWRYPHGIRGVAGFAYGMSRLPWSTFLAFNFVAAGLWSGVILSAGHAYGHLSEKLMNDAFSGLGMAMLMVFLVLSWILSRKLERIVESRCAGEPPPATGIGDRRI